MDDGEARQHEVARGFTGRWIRRRSVRLDRVRGAVVDHGDVQPAAGTQLTEQPVEFRHATVAGTVVRLRPQGLLAPFGVGKLP